MPVPVGPGDKVKQDADKNIASDLDGAIKDLGEALDKATQCSFGRVCSSDDSEKQDQPNIGKDLTDAEKAELGGSGSGTPGGWEPQDEENARNQQSTGAGSNKSAEAISCDIADGHAYEKHVIQQNEYADLGIKTKEQFAQHLENVVKNPTSTKELTNGRSAYWDQSSGTVVIRNPKAADGGGGTAFRPTNGRAYFDNLR